MFCRDVDPCKMSQKESAGINAHSSMQKAAKLKQNQQN